MHCVYRFGERVCRNGAETGTRPHQPNSLSRPDRSADTLVVLSADTPDTSDLYSGITMKNVFFALWSEPRAEEPPRRVWRDWALVAVLVPAAVLDALLRGDVAFRPLALVVAVALILPLLWRRTHPLAVVAIVFGLLAVVHSAILIGAEPMELVTTVSAVLFPYSLLRWGSGREIVAGLSIMLVAFSLAAFELGSVGETAAAIAFLLLLPAAIGASVRFRASALLRGIESAKLRERGNLARELHDTVAHHVSAILIQAQAGRMSHASQPGASLDALVVIEEEASRTLVELRTIVGALREGDGPDLAPQRSVDDVQQLAADLADSPRVEVELSGDLDDIAPPVAAAIYRLTQESITNSMRHAHNATRIKVVVDGDVDRVHLTIRDDGDPVTARGQAERYGLIGMTERATLLGGTLDAGPDPDAGWAVTAVLPKSGISA